MTRERPEHNIFTPSSKDSVFFSIAPLADKIIENIDSHIDVRRFNLAYKNSKKLVGMGIPEASQSSALDIELINLPYFKNGVKNPHIYVLGSPESEATSFGRMVLDDNNKLHFQLARFHTGYGALKDMSYAMKQSLYVSDIAGLFAEDKSEDDSFLVSITREGPMIRFESSIYNVFRKNIPYTIASCSHKPDSDPGNTFGRISDEPKINFEGLDPNQARTIIIADNTASGMQTVKVFETIMKYIHDHNGTHGPRVDTLLIVSPLLAHYGALTISYAAAEYGVRTIFACSGHLLGCIGPERYFSPIQNNERLSANPELIKLNQFILRGNTEKVCARCNWTASFSAEKAAYESSENELNTLGLSNSVVLERGLMVDINKLGEFNINPKSLIPYSTKDEAYQRDIGQVVQDF